MSTTPNSNGICRRWGCVTLNAATSSGPSPVGRAPPQTRRPRPPITLHPIERDTVPVRTTLTLQGQQTDPLTTLDPSLTKAITGKLAFTQADFPGSTKMAMGSRSVTSNRSVREMHKAGGPAVSSHGFSACSVRPTGSQPTIIEKVNDSSHRRAPFGAPCDPHLSHLTQE